MNGTYCYSHSCSFFSQNTKSIKPGILWSGKQSKLSQPPTSGDTGATAQGLGASPVHFPGRVLFSAKRRRRTVALRRWAPRPPACPRRSSFPCLEGGSRREAAPRAGPRRPRASADGRRKRPTPWQPCRREPSSPKGTALHQGRTPAWVLGAENAEHTKLRLLKDLKQTAQSQLTKNLPGPRPHAGSPRPL